MVDSSCPIDEIRIGGWVSIGIPNPFWVLQCHVTQTHYPAFSDRLDLFWMRILIPLHKKKFFHRRRQYLGVALQEGNNVKVKPWTQMLFLSTTSLGNGALSIYQLLSLCLPSQLSLNFHPLPCITYLLPASSKIAVLSFNSNSLS